MESNTAIQEELYFEGEWSPFELKLFEPPEDISTADYAERYLSVIKSAKPGPWRNKNNPPLIGIMNAADRKGAFKNLLYMTLLKCVQGGGSVAVRNIVFKRMDFSGQSCLFIMDTDRKAKRTANQIIIPLLRISPRLSKQMSDNPDDTSNYSIVMKTGFHLNMGWAGSQSSVSSEACETVVIEEVDKSSKPMNIEEAKDRITTFTRTGLVISLSTPGLENGPISVEFENSDTAMDYYVECPYCDESQIMSFDNYWWPKKGEPVKDTQEQIRLANKILREQSARYACQGCGVLWDDYERDRAVTLGEKRYFHGWKMRENIEFPISIGFHLPAWTSPFKSLSHSVARWLKARCSAVPGKMRAWRNQEAAEPYIESQEGESVSGELLYNRRYNYCPKGAEWQVPMDASVLTCFADVQVNRIEAGVYAWGPGMQSWGITSIIFPGDPSLVRGAKGSPWNLLYDFIINRQWLHESGAKLKIAISGVDSGYLAPKVYSFVLPLSSRRVYACKGSPVRGRQLITIASKQSKQKRVLDMYGVTLVTIGTETAKDQIHANMQIEAQGPGYMNYHNGYSIDHFKQLTAEHAVNRYDKRGRLYRVWEEKNKSAPNEQLDICVGNLAMIELLNPDFERLAEGLKNQVNKEEAPNARSGNKKGKGFVHGY